MINNNIRILPASTVTFCDFLPNWYRWCGRNLNAEKLTDLNSVMLTPMRRCRWFIVRCQKPNSCFQFLAQHIDSFTSCYTQRIFRIGKCFRQMCKNIMTFWIVSFIPSSICSPSSERYVPDLHRSYARPSTLTILRTKMLLYQDIQNILPAQLKYYSFSPYLGYSCCPCDDPKKC